MQPDQPPSPWARPSDPATDPAAAPPAWAPPPTDPGAAPPAWAPPPTDPGAAPAGWPTTPGVSGQIPVGWTQPVPYPPPSPARRGPNPKLVIGLVAVLLIALGAGAAGVNAWAKHSICSAIENENLGDNSASGSRSDGLDQGDIDNMRHVADQLRNRARMVVFDGSLRKAANGLADDVENLADLLGSAATTDDAMMGGGLAELMMVAASVNGHARQAQRACGLAAKGIFNQ